MQQANINREWKNIYKENIKLKVTLKSEAIRKNKTSKRLDTFNLQIEKPNRHNRDIYPDILDIHIWKT